MADIRVINIIPGQPIAGVQQPPSSTSAGTQGNANLANIPSGTVLNGFIINRDASGNPILRTANGDIAFSSNFFLKIGSEISIRIETNTTGTLAHILSINGQPPEIAEAQSAFAQETEITVGQNLSPEIASATSNSAPSSPTITVSGTLVSPPPPSPGNPLAPLPPGTQLTLKVTNLTSAPNSIPEEILTYAPPQAQTSPQTQASPQSPPANPVFYTAYAKAASTPVSAPVTNIPTSQTPAAAAPESPTPLPPSSALPTGQIVTATVIGNHASGETSLQTPLGVIRLQPGVTLPAGSTVTLEITNTELPPEQTVPVDAALSPTPAPLLELAQHWTSLQQIFSLLTGRDPTSAIDTIQDAMPWVLPQPTAAMQAQAQATPAQVPQNIPAGLMLFMAALRGGNFSNWLGQNNTQWLQDQGHDALIKRADGEFTMLARQFTESQPQHWQPLFFPVAIGNELQQVRLFVKRDRKQNPNPQGKKQDDTRFVVEVDLTQLGEMQMDGFVRRRDKDVQFDLVIRSLIPLSNEIQQDILNIYSKTGELAGYKGSINFQTVRDFPVNPMEEIAARSGTVVA